MKDKAGTEYSSSDNKPATAGTQVKIHTPNGTVPGTMTSGGYVKPNDKK